MSWKQLGTVVMCLGMIAAAVYAEDQSKAEPGLQIFTEVPVRIDPDARYLFYLHGAIIERAGVRPTHPKFGVYEYQKILEVFAERGFVVISEARPRGTDGMSMRQTVADQVRALIRRWRAARAHHGGRLFEGRWNSHRGFIDTWRATKLNFVFMARLRPVARLPARDRRLEAACCHCASRQTSWLAPARASSVAVRAHPTTEEILLDLGGGHGAFYRPRRSGSIRLSSGL